MIFNLKLELKKVRKNKKYVNVAIGYRSRWEVLFWSLDLCTWYMVKGLVDGVPVH